MRTTHSPDNVIANNTACGAHGPHSTGRRALAAAITAGAFIGLSGVVAPMASAQDDVKGKIGEEYVAAAEANGQTPEEFFGATTSSELDAANGGKFQTFENDKSIYWNPDVSGGQANQVGGEIFDRWGEATMNGSPGYEWGPLHYPTTREWATAESGASGVAGRGNHFEGGSIYWSPDTGAHVVWGLIRDAWWHLGAESSALGLPIGEESFDGSSYVQQFEGGYLYLRTDGLARVSTDDSPAETEPVPISDLRIE